MSSNDHGTMYPFLRYQDASKALDYLVDAYGFEKAMVVPGEGDSIAHAELRLGTGYVMIGTGPDLSERDTDGLAPQGVYIYVDDADAHFAHAKSAGAVITREIEDTEYGSREYSTRDPGGYSWSFGTYRPEAGS